ncbi:hypothetical protein BZA77DRAFT_354255 [Pyronema omphalodes]|nr:hypothetical protein BZA77DRAFT_354255 [Pyronema omphalodes]
MPAISIPVHDIRLAETVAEENLKDVVAEKNEKHEKNEETSPQLGLTDGSTSDNQDSKSADPAEDGDVKNIMPSEKSGNEKQLLEDKKEEVSAPVDMHLRPIYDLRSSYKLSGDNNGKKGSGDRKQKEIGSIFPFYDPKSPEEALGYCLYDPAEECSSCSSPPPLDNPQPPSTTDTTDTTDSNSNPHHLQRRGWKSFFRTINPLNCCCLSSWDKSGRAISYMPEAWPNDPPYPPHPPHYDSPVRVLDNRWAWDPPHEPQLPVMEPRPAFWEPLDVSLRTPPNEWNGPIPPAGPLAYLYPDDAPVHMGTQWYPELYPEWETLSDSDSGSEAGSGSDTPPLPAPHVLISADTGYPGIMDYDEWVRNPAPLPVDTNWVGHSWYNPQDIYPTDVPTPGLSKSSPPPPPPPPVIHLSNGGRPYDPGNFEIPEIMVTPPTPPPGNADLPPFRIIPSLWSDSDYEPPVIVKRDVVVMGDGDDVMGPVNMGKDGAVMDDVALNGMGLLGGEMEMANYTGISMQASGAQMYMPNGLVMLGAVVFSLLFGRR